MNPRTSDLLAYGLLAVSALAGLLVWSSLPDTMAIHFGISGEPDRFVPKPLAVVLAPAIGVAGVLVTRYAPARFGGTHGPPAVEHATVVFISGTVAYLQGFVLAWNLGHRVGSNAILVPVLLAAAALAGYAYRQGESAA